MGSTGSSSIGVVLRINMYGHFKGPPVLYQGGSGPRPILAGRGIQSCKNFELYAQDSGAYVKTYIYMYIYIYVFLYTYMWFIHIYILACRFISVLNLHPYLYVVHSAEARWRRPYGEAPTTTPLRRRMVTGTLEPVKV